MLARPRSVLAAALCTASALTQAPQQPPGSQDPPPSGQVQEPPDPTLAPVIVTATGLAQDPFDSPFSTDAVDEELILRRGYRTTPQALRDIPGIMIQETAFGQGSPFIRGFTGFRNLLMIDGVRLNNSVFRSGPNQYWNTVDPLSVERFEVVKGPSSVLYGSDAIGGTVNAITRNPYIYGDAGVLAHGGSTFLRYATAEDSIIGRGELSMGYVREGDLRTGMLLGGSAKSFGDLEGGGGTGTQPETGYDELDLDLKLDHQLSERTNLVFLHQAVRQNDVPRTHRTISAVPWRGTTVGSDLQRNLDQERRLTYLQLHVNNVGSAVQEVHANLSWHEQEEVRDRIRGNGDQEFQGFEVGTLGSWLHLVSDTTIGQLSYGVDYYHDEVDSFLNRPSNPSPGDNIQGPVADDATYDLLGIYLQDWIEVSDDFDLYLGGRFNYAAADAQSVRDPVTDMQISIEDDWSDLVGSARLRYGLVPGNLNLFGGVSQGFRAPNLSDLTRFDSARTNEFEIPAPGLDAENYVSYEVGLKADTSDATMQAAYFYTDIEDQIVRFPTGNTNPGGEAEITKANVGDGYIQGVEFQGGWRFVPTTTLFGNFTWMDGEVTNFDNPTSTLQPDYPSRLMPITAQLGLRWEEPVGNLWAETVLMHAEDADKLSFRDQGDTSRIPPGGTPGYTLWNIRAGWQISDSTSLDVILDNVTDADFRVHGSGLNGPGRNLIIALKTYF